MITSHWFGLLAAVLVVGVKNDEACFRKLVQSNRFVDKTAFIKWVYTVRRSTYITAPRQFGKSTNLDMVRRFYETPVDSAGARVPHQDSEDYQLFTRTYFDNATRLKVFEDQPFFTNNFGRFPVLSLNFALIEVGTPESFLASVNQMLKLACSKMKYLTNSNALMNASREIFSKLQSSHPVVDSISEIDYTAFSITKAIHDHFNMPCLLLIDEMDAPIQKQLASAAVQDVTNNLQYLLRMLLKGNTHVWKGVCFGQVRLESFLSSGANNLLHVRFHEDPEAASFFGSTRSEVEGMKKLFPRGGRLKMETVEYFYGSYTVVHEYTEQTVKLFNTYSVREYFIAGVPASSWCMTGRPPFLTGLLSITGVMEFVRKTILGHDIVISIVQFNTEHFKALKDTIAITKESDQELILSFDKNDLVMQYLYELGYFTKTTRYEGTIRIPNEEIRRELGTIFVTWWAKYFCYEAEQRNNYVNALMNLGKNSEGHQKFVDSIANLFGSCKTLPTTKDQFIDPLLSFLTYDSLKSKVQLKVLPSHSSESEQSDLIMLRKNVDTGRCTGLVINAAYKKTSKDALKRIIYNKDYVDFQNVQPDLCQTGAVSDFILVGLNFSPLKISASILYNDTQVDLGNEYSCKIAVVKRYKKKILAFMQHSKNFTQNGWKAMRDAFKIG